MKQIINTGEALLQKYSLTIQKYTNLIYSHCTVVGCAPFTLKNGTLVHCGGSLLASGSYPVGTKVTFVCDPGYKLSGSRSSTCQTSGLWSHQPPTCNQGNGSWEYDIRDIIQR